MGQFVAGHVLRDTMWIELTGFPSAAGWPPGARAALVRNPRGAPFMRLRGYVPPPPPPVDSTQAGGEGDEERRRRPARAAAPPPPAPEPVEERPYTPPPSPVEEIPPVTAPPPAPYDTLLVPNPPIQQPQRPRRQQPANPPPRVLGTPAPSRPRRSTPACRCRATPFAWATRGSGNNGGNFG